MKNNNKKGSALAIALVLSSVLLLLGLSYSKLTSNTNVSTQKIDERVRLKYLADGANQIALLKLQKFPAEFYAALEVKNTNTEPWEAFCGKSSNDDHEFKEGSFFNDQTIAFNSSREKGKVINAAAGRDRVSINVTDITLQTVDQNGKAVDKWNNDVITITSTAVYTDFKGDSHKVESKLTVLANRTTIR